MMICACQYNIQSNLNNSTSLIPWKFVRDLPYNFMIKFPLICVFLSFWKNFIGTQIRVRISHGKRATGVRAIEV